MKIKIKPCFVACMTLSALLSSTLVHARQARRAFSAARRLAPSRPNVAIQPLARTQHALPLGIPLALPPPPRSSAVQAAPTSFYASSKREILRTLALVAHEHFFPRTAHCSSSLYRAPPNESEQTMGAKLEALIRAFKEATGRMDELFNTVVFAVNVRVEKDRLIYPAQDPPGIFYNLGNRYPELRGKPTMIVIVRPDLDKIDDFTIATMNETLESNDPEGTNFVVKEANLYEGMKYFYLSIGTKPYKAAPAPSSIPLLSPKFCFAWHQRTQNKLKQRLQNLTLDKWKQSSARSFDLAISDEMKSIEFYLRSFFSKRSGRLTISNVHIKDPGVSSQFRIEGDIDTIKEALSALDKKIKVEIESLNRLPNFGNHDEKLSSSRIALFETAP
jgi:hypothetical protein